MTTSAALDRRTGVDDGWSDGGEVVRRAVEQARSAILSVADAPAWARSDAELKELIVASQQVASGIDELTARLVAEAISRDLPTDEGATNPTNWLEGLLHCSQSRAAALTAHAHAVLELYTEPAMPVAYEDAEQPDLATRHAWASGTISGEHAVLISKALADVQREIDADGLATPPAPEALRRAEHTLVQQARGLRFRDFRLVANRLVEVMAPERADQILGDRLLEQERRAFEATSLTISNQRDGTHRIAGRIPDLHAAMLRTALEAVASPRRARTDDEPAAGSLASRDAHDLPRYDQRLGRAFCELLEHLPTDELPRHGNTGAAVVVTIDHERLRTPVGEALLTDGTAISVGEARRLACNAGILPAVLGGDSAILDLGTSQRLFDHHQRVALAVRDRCCVWPGCDRPPGWCEAHHIDPWSHGGPTDLANAALLCGHHHRHLHRSDWRLATGPDKVPELVPPRRLDPEQTPQRHHRFSVRRT